MSEAEIAGRFVQGSLTAMTTPTPTPPPDDLARPERGAMSEARLRWLNKSLNNFRSSNTGCGDCRFLIDSLAESLGEIERLRAENARLKADGEAFGRVVGMMATTL